jgi:hypothetical protein
VNSPPPKKDVVEGSPVVLGMWPAAAAASSAEVIVSTFRKGWVGGRTIPGICAALVLGKGRLGIDVGIGIVPNKVAPFPDIDTAAVEDGILKDTLRVRVLGGVVVIGSCGGVVDCKNSWASLEV